jgi:hypothetical protein
MTVAKKSRIPALIGAVALVTAAACADSITQPTTPGTRAARDTVPEEIEGDTLMCKSGWIIQSGRYVCLGSGG